MVHVTATWLLRAVEQGPEPEDVKAGWTAFAIFLLLCAAVAFLGWSLMRQLRKAQAAKDAGVYGDPPVTAQGPVGETGDPVPGADPEPDRTDGRPSDREDRSRG